MATRDPAAEGLRPGLARADDAFDRMARLVCRHLGVPVAAVALLTPDGLVLPGAVGLPDREQATRRLVSHPTMTRRVVETGVPLVLSDVTEDPLVAKACEGFGAGRGAVAVMPMYATEERPVGALVAMAPAPRRWTEDDLATLTDLAASCSDKVRLRAERERARQAELAARREQHRSALLLSLSESFAGATTPAQVERALRSVLARGTGASASYLALVQPDGRGIGFVSGAPHQLGPLPRDAPTPFGQAVGLPDPPPPIREAIQQGHPVYCGSMAELVARYPELDGRLTFDGACSVLPVHSDGRVAAVICILWEMTRPHDAEAAALEATLAPYVAHALDRVSLLEARREVATTLQSALLTSPPTVAHLEIATTYAPAMRTDQVGGDWYDVVAVDDVTTLLMIGDVAGHDMQAAAHMGQLRSMLRALAWSHDETPSVLLTLLDRMNDQLGPQAGATAVVARLERLPVDEARLPGTYAVTWSNAGHPPPLVLRRDGTVEMLRPPTDLLLGVLPSFERQDHTTTLLPGETLLLYTDGLVESRGTMLADRIRLLADVFRSAADTATAALPATLMRALVPTPQRDDIAVLAVRARESATADETVTVPALKGATALVAGDAADRHDGADDGPDTAGDEAPSPLRVERRVPHSLAVLGPTRRWIDDILETSGVGTQERRTAMLLSSELLTNALEHGAGPVVAMVEVDADQALVRVGVRDTSRIPPRLQEPAPHELSGRGILFLDRLATRWGVDDHEEAQAVGRHGEYLSGKTVWFELCPDGPQQNLP